MRRLFISFSGGETSAFMTWWILNNWKDRYDEMAVVFANTGEENEQTLLFVALCAYHWDIPVTWVEAVIHHGERKNPTARIVDYASASRLGEPFEEMIQKYGIPNTKFKHCTRTLKLRPMEDYIRNHLGWEAGSYDTAIGIRTDEVDRISSKAKEHRIVYPLVDAKPMRKSDINTFWAAMPFRLGLKGYEGNCKWCWKKSLRKHVTLMGEHPEHFDFPERMERIYGGVGAEFLHDPATRRSPLPEGYRRTFFREGKTVQDIRNERATRIASGTFKPADDDAIVYSDFDPTLDIGGGCEESCEVFADEDLGDEE